MKLDSATVMKLICFVFLVAACVILAALKLISGGEALGAVTALGLGVNGGLSLISIARVIGATFGGNAPASPDAKPATPPALPASATAVAIAPVALLAMLLCGCGSISSIEIVRGAADVSNSSTTLENIVAPMIEAKCVAPMKLLSAGSTTQASIDALQAKCKPLVEAYDTERHVHLLEIAGIVKAESTTGIDVSALIDLGSQLATAVAQLVKEIGQ